MKAENIEGEGKEIKSKYAVPASYHDYEDEQLWYNKIFEDEISVAFLDIKPRSKGMLIVVPKEHLENFFEKKEISIKLFQNALFLAEKIKKVFNAKDVWLSTISSAFKHINIRIYPVYKDRIPLIENEPLELDENELRTIADKIISAISKPQEKNNRKKKKKYRKRKKVKSLEKEKIKWIKRWIEIT